MSQPLIDLKNISKSFDGELVLDDLNLSIKENSFVTLLGPSGCGKTTTLRILGGFVSPDTGNVIFDGQDITKLVQPFACVENFCLAVSMSFWSACLVGYQPRVCISVKSVF